MPPNRHYGQYQMATYRLMLRPKMLGWSSSTAFHLDPLVPHLPVCMTALVGMGQVQQELGYVVTPYGHRFTRSATGSLRAGPSSVAQLHRQSQIYSQSRRCVHHLIMFRRC